MSLRTPHAREAPTDAFGYGDPLGSAALREVLAAYLRRVRGAAADPQRLVISTGFAQGLNLVYRALARQGVRRVAVEDPGDFDQPAIAARAGLQRVPVRTVHCVVEPAGQRREPTPERLGRPSPQSVHIGPVAAEPGA